MRGPRWRSPTAPIGGHDEKSGDRTADQVDIETRALLYPRLTIYCRGGAVLMSYANGLDQGRPDIIEHEPETLNEAIGLLRDWWKVRYGDEKQSLPVQRVRRPNGLHTARGDAPRR